MGTVAYSDLTYSDQEWHLGESQSQNRHGSRNQGSRLLKRQHGKALEILQLFLQTKIEGVAGKMLLVSMGALDLCLWCQVCGMAAHQDRAPRGKSCTPSSNVCSLRIDLEDHLGQVDTVFFFADNVL